MMKLETLFENFHLLANSLSGIKKLREMILEYAVQGKLVPQDPNDEPAEKLLEKIRVEQQTKKFKSKLTSKKNNNKSKKIFPDCTTVEKLSVFLIQEFNNLEFKIEDVLSKSRCDKQKLIKFIFELIKKQNFQVDGDIYEINIPINLKVLFFN